MKTLLSVLAATMAGSTVASAVIFSSSGSQMIPDGNITGIESTINVSGLSALQQETMLSFTLSLNITGGRNGDLYAYLTHDGITAVLLNRVGRGEVAGGYSDSGFQIVFQDGSPDVHTYQTSGQYANNGFGQISGTFEADGRNVSPYTVTSSDTRSSNPFSAFTGGNTEGNWTLYLADVNGNAMAGTLDSWSMDITGVPEPTNVALGIFGGGFAVLQGFRFWKRKQAETKSNS